MFDEWKVFCGLDTTIVNLSKDESFVKDSVDMFLLLFYKLQKKMAPCIPQPSNFCPLLF
jgi:hypothetical protein